MSRPEYRTPEYLAEKRRLAEMVVPCSWCGVRRATTPDHDPPLIVAPKGPWRLVPSCERCNLKRGQRLAAARRSGGPEPANARPFPPANWW